MRKRKSPNLELFSDMTSWVKYYGGWTIFSTHYFGNVRSYWWRTDVDSRPDTVLKCSVSSISTHGQGFHFQFDLTVGHSFPVCSKIVYFEWVQNAKSDVKYHLLKCCVLPIGQGFQLSVRSNCQAFLSTIPKIVYMVWIQNAESDVNYHLPDHYW
jgi:hypothetical protein